MRRRMIHMVLSLVLMGTGCRQAGREAARGPLRVSQNGRWLVTRDGHPFFWLGDTGWLLFSKLNLPETEIYLEDRHRKGFNVIQVMVLHGLQDTDAGGDSALANGNLSTPRIEPHGFWSHVDSVIDRAAALGIYIALVPIWGSNVKAGLVSRKQAADYARFLALRYRSKPNIIWINGGDTKGSDSTAQWKLIGTMLRRLDPSHLITFHPFGRTGSFDWFQQAPWLDLNLFQSGHRRYDQDSSARAYGEDNWKYVREEYALRPAKPVLDGEPSYEGIPQGLHDTTQPRWTDSDVRRYAFWSVFAGACGFTYGDNAVMQMHRAADGPGAYGARRDWHEAIQDPGASEMGFLAKLMYSRPYFERVFDPDLIANPEPRLAYAAATRGRDYAFIYTYTGRMLRIRMGRIRGKNVQASWYNPRNGKTVRIGKYPNRGIMAFDPPGDPGAGRDWVLILDRFN